MIRRFEAGDHVTWNSEAGYVSGKIINVHRRDVDYKGYTHQASKEEPQYVIKSDRTDHIAMHKGSLLEGQGLLSAIFSEFVWPKHPPLYLNLFGAPAKFHEVFDELMLAHSNKKVRKDFSRSLEMTTTVISNKVRDLSFSGFRRSPSS
jgi:Hypervirulence associated proteins TUDOR domain